MLTKTCNKCKVEKPNTEFPKEKTGRHGTRSFCKICDRKEKERYRRSKIGVARFIYLTQCKRSKILDYHMPKYTAEELRDWLFSKDLFHRLYDKWVESEYNMWLRPSVDRKDDYKGYFFDNIQLMTWKENNMKNHTDRVNGINNKKSKAVLQYDMDGNFIAEYFSLVEAQRQTGICRMNIGSVCKRRTRHAGGFKWEYKNK